MSKHSFFAPSESHIWVNCPYMLRLKYLYERELEKPAGIEAQRGTLMHEYVARILNYIQKKYYIEQIKEEHFAIIEKDTIQREIGKYEGDEKDLDIIINEVFLYLRNILKNTRWHNVNIEKKYETTYFGTIDLNFIDNDKNLHVVDFKFGKVLVNVENNLQLMLYDLLILNNVTSKVKKCFPVYNYIIQPEVGISGCKVTIYDLEKLKEKIDNIIHVFNQTKNEYLTGNVGSHCTYCKYKCKCGAALKDAKVFELMLEDYNEHILDPVTVNKNLDKINNIERLCKEYKEYIIEKQKTGEIILENYSIIETRRETLNADKEDTILEILNDYNIKAYKKELITISDLKKMYPKKEDQNEYNKIIDKLKEADCINTTYSKPYLKKKGRY